MPYRIVGTTVQVKHGKRWTTFARHTSVAKAQAQLAALHISQAHGTSRSRRRVRRRK